MPIGSPKTDHPPRGWVASDGALKPDPTVGGYIARGQEVRGYCHQRDCRRNCHLDLVRMHARGWGALEVGLIKQMMRCQRLDGCALDFSEDRKQGTLPLKALLGFSHVSVKIACAHCKFFRRVSVEGLIAKLKKEGVGDESTSFTEVDGLIKGACKQCHKKYWRVDVLWPNTDTIGWRAGLRD